MNKIKNIAHVTNLYTLRVYVALEIHPHFISLAKAGHHYPLVVLVCT